MVSTVIINIIIVYLQNHVNMVQVHLSGEGLRAGRERERRYGGGGQLSSWGEGRGAIREGGRSSI